MPESDPVKHNTILYDLMSDIENQRPGSVKLPLGTPNPEYTVVSTRDPRNYFTAHWQVTKHFLTLKIL